MQTRLQSLVESIVNVIIGILIGVASQLIIFPLFGIEVELYENFLIAGWFTFVSLTRSYIIRRWFARRTG